MNRGALTLLIFASQCCNPVQRLTGRNDTCDFDFFHPSLADLFSSHSNLLHPPLLEALQIIHSDICIANILNQGFLEDNTLSADAAVLILIELERW